MIENLGFTGLQLSPDRCKLEMHQAGDEYYYASLTREEVEEFAQDLLALAAQMVPSDATTQT